MKNDDARPYHHGALETALVERALDQVRAAGSENFSVRQAAREIGVSPGAAYRHFRTKDELLAAVGRCGDAMLAERMAAARARAGDIRAEAIGIGLAYVAFAREEPRLFQLMLAVPPPAGACEKACGPAAAPGAEDSAYGQLRAVVRRYLGGDGAAREDVIERCCDFLWVIAHGLASIEATTGWQRSRDDLVAILEMGLATLDAERQGGR